MKYFKDFLNLKEGYKILWSVRESNPVFSELYAKELGYACATSVKSP